MPGVQQRRNYWGNNNMSLGAEIVRKQETMASQRGIWETHWREIAELILPRQDDFDVRRADGEKRTSKIYDATGALSLERFGAVMDSMLTPRGQRWHGLQTTNVELRNDKEVTAWMEEVTRILFAARYSVKANFSAQNSERNISLGAFGTGAMLIEDATASGSYLRYKSIHLAELFIDENKHGIIDKVNRRFEFTARQAMQMWGKELPEQIREAYEKTPERKFEFIHSVMPNEEIQHGRADHRGMEFASYYVSVLEKKLLSTSGYRTMPYSVSRYITAPKEIYGRSPAMLVLPDIKMLNEMSKSTIRQAQKVVEPPLLVTDDGVMTRISTRPNALNYGGIDPISGNPNIRPLDTGGNVGLGLEMMEQRREIIKDAFLVNLFQILEKNPRMTATEVLERSKEKGALLGPSIGRQQSEALGPMIERELDILQHAGALPPMPDALLEAEGEYDIVYDSPLNRAQHAEEGIGMLRTVEALAPLLQTSQDPQKIMRRFNMDEVVKGLAEINAVPQKWQYSDEELAAMDEQEAQQQQQAQLLEAAPIAAQTAKTMAEAQSLSQGGQVGGI